MEGLETQVVEKKKRVLTPEHLAKMQAGRGKKKESVIAPEIIISLPKIKVFGDTDRTPRGKIKSEFPSWYFDMQKEDLKKEIKDGERAIQSGAIPYPIKERSEYELAKKKVRLANIEEETPKLKGSEKDSVVKMREGMGRKIAEAKFGRSEMEKGLADAHEEAHRMVDPVIRIETEAEGEFAKACGIKINDGKVSRNEMEKMHKIASKMVGESTDIEYLSKP